MKKLKRIFDIINEKGIGFFFKKMLVKILPNQINDFELLKKILNSKYGLEVGGPSGIFRDKGFIPLYKIVGGLDGCNFSNSTIWEGNIEHGGKYNYYQNKEGVQYISEATDLSFISDSEYDFVISSNCLEHVANPLKALKEWIRVLKKEGVILLVLPNKEYCFDHKRPVTKFSHLLEDYQNKIKEDDLTHLNEILDLHDLKMDTPAGNLQQFRERSLNNFENRALHQHIFNIPVLKEMFDYFKLEVILTHEGQEFIIVGKKSI